MGVSVVPAAVAPAVTPEEEEEEDGIAEAAEEDEGRLPDDSGRSAEAAQLSSSATARSEEYCASRNELEISTEWRWRTFSSRDFLFLPQHQINPLNVESTI